MLLFVPEAGFFEPNYVSSDLLISSISHAAPVNVALASADMELVLGTPGGGAELLIYGAGFSSDASKMRVDLFWVSLFGTAQQAGCEVLTSNYSSLRCRTLSAPDVRLAVGQTIGVNVSIPLNVIPSLLFDRPELIPTATAPMRLRFLDWAEAPL